jgi:intracellular multiplication protein IcmD
MDRLKRQKLKVFSVLSILTFGVFALFLVDPAFAADPGSATGLGGLATNITKSFGAIGQLMIGTAYLAGIGFSIAAIFKFKQHKDNPTQIPVGTPIALLVIAICLVFLPMLFNPAGETIFGSKASEISSTSVDGLSGGGVELLPGSAK